MKKNLQANAAKKGIGDELLWFSFQCISSFHFYLIFDFLFQFIEFISFFKNIRAVEDDDGSYINWLWLCGLVFDGLMDCGPFSYGKCNVARPVMLIVWSRFWNVEALCLILLAIATTNWLNSQWFSCQNFGVIN